MEQAFRPAFRPEGERLQPLRYFVTIPHRGTTGDGTYFVTASTWEKQGLLQSERMAKLFIDVLFHYQKQSKYRLHEFVVMPNHVHLLLTPRVDLSGPKKN